jgi:hypothetical protein
VCPSRHFFLLLETLCSIQIHDTEQHTLNFGDPSDPCYLEQPGHWSSRLDKGGQAWPRSACMDCCWPATCYLASDMQRVGTTDPNARQVRPRGSDVPHQRKAHVGCDLQGSSLYVSVCTRNRRDTRGVECGVEDNVPTSARQHRGRGHPEIHCPHDVLLPRRLRSGRAIGTPSADMCVR